MKKMLCIKKLLCIIIAAAICFIFGACTKSEPTSAPAGNTEVKKGEAYFYVGRGDAYKKIGVGYEGELTADMLIEKMSRVTGWNLTLSDSVIYGEDSMRVDFSKESSVYTGVADSEVDGFTATNKDNLICTILDSVSYSLQGSFAGGDEEFKIYFSCEGEAIEVNGKAIDIEAPYTAASANKYSLQQAEEFLIHQLSGYYDTPDTIYKKYDEAFEGGELFYIYRATDKKSGELLGSYKFPASLDALYEETANGDYELLWSMDLAILAD